MAKNEYIYAVARIRAKELSLFSTQTMERLMGTKSDAECVKLLKELGWGSYDTTADGIFTAEREKIWQLMGELVEDLSVFDVFLYENDYHNLKAAIKQACLKGEVPNIFLKRGTVPVNLIRQAVNEKNFTLLPPAMQACAEEAYELQLKGGDSQMCDVVIDRAALDAIYATGKASEEEIFAAYAEQKVAAANINIALRGSRLRKGREFFAKALAPCDTLNVFKLAEAAVANEEAVFGYLENTVYADAIDKIKESSSAFECWCDNRMMAKIKPQKYNAFGIGPLAAYILARENEIKSVRILLTGKRNGLAEEKIRERLREMYV